MPISSGAVAILGLLLQLQVPVRVEIPVADLKSPRLLALKGETGEASLKRFWEEVGKEGAPLVEPVPADDHYSLVTFLWHGNRDTRGVFILGSIASNAPMAHLEGTDVWYRSYLVRKDARFTYRLAPVRGTLDPDKPGDRSKIRETAQIDPLNPRRHPPSGPPLLSLAELPEAPAQPWIAKRPGTPAGTEGGDGPQLDPEGEPSRSRLYAARVRSWRANPFVVDRPRRIGLPRPHSFTGDPRQPSRGWPSAAGRGRPRGATGIRRAGE